MGHEFRRDIEGLRAAAVLPVLLFHMRSDLCPGGFIGVDVFFVISGYLITRMILAEGEQFRFRSFYVRRFFRLFPALLTTLVVSLAAGWWFLAPIEYEELARSGLAAGFGVSNFFFLFSIDYFNPSGLSRPFLHTWSLGAEEQFYLVWPALLILAWRWRCPLLPLFAGMVALSMAALWLLQASHPELVFYMMPFRVFEFAIGASVLALEAHWARLPASVNFLAGSFAAVLLVGSLLQLDTQTPWPGVATLAPSLATALLLLSGARGLWSTVLGFGALRFVGRISYSLYLVHWPLFAFYRIYSITEPSPRELALLLGASVLLAALLYVGVEAPFRMRGRSQAALEGGLLPGGALPRGFVAASLVVGGVAGLSGAAAVLATNGVPSRLDRISAQLLEKGLTNAGDLCSRQPFVKGGRCLFGDRDSNRIVYLVGDSHALNLIYGLDRLFRDAGIKGVALHKHSCLFAFGTTRFLNGVADDKCRRYVEDAYEYLAGNRRPVIIAGHYAFYRNSMGPTDASAPPRQSEDDYYAWLEQRLLASLDKLDARHRTVILVRQLYDTGVDLTKCLLRPGAAEGRDKQGCAPLKLHEVQALFLKADRMIDRIANALPSVRVIDPKPFFAAARPAQQSIPRGVCIFSTPRILPMQGRTSWSDG